MIGRMSMHAYACMYIYIYIFYYNILWGHCQCSITQPLAGVDETGTSAVLENAIFDVESGAT